MHNGNKALNSVVVKKCLDLTVRTCLITLVFAVIAAIILLLQRTIVYASSESVREILSIKTGNEPNNIGNQFVGVPQDPYSGFAINTKGNIFISDTVNSRIIRFSKDAIFSGQLTVADKPDFLPKQICIDDKDNVYALDTRREEIIVFSPDNQISRHYSPKNVFSNEESKVTILSLSCEKTVIKMAYGIKEPKIVRPVYQDKYDHEFNLLNRKIFNDQISYFTALMEADRDKLFEDSRGYKYGYPLEEDWYEKFLPLNKYSSDGRLLSTIDGPWLTKHTKYKVFDYYTNRGALVLDLIKMKNNDFMIVNWYVTLSGNIYCLVANTEQIKVIEVLDP